MARFDGTPKESQYVTCLSVNSHMAIYRPKGEPKERVVHAKSYAALNYCLALNPPKPYSDAVFRKRLLELVFDGAC
jgi:hypothetical protein